MSGMTTQFKDITPSYKEVSPTIAMPSCGSPNVAGSDEGSPTVASLDDSCHVASLDESCHVSAFSYSEGSPNVALANILDGNGC